ncbi:helix-turn-helix domain-containing protein [Ruminiclostridium cellobioparum]|uniref:helix-turn-helix domain-containing protein n=1 Tax=Ruminiclostridium cellobioparum TaxID=29355 RepID=UPI0028AA50E6|nr:helix-turn-helix domain-containing protein [Ruminiclostridium cellobioparum]
MANKKSNNNLKMLRESKGMTLKELSKSSGVHLSYISSLERGEKSNPSIDIIQKLSKGLGMSEQEVLDLGFKSSVDNFIEDNGKILFVECSPVKHDNPESKNALMRVTYSHNIASIINSSSFLNEKDLVFILNQLETTVNYIKITKTSTINKEGDTP